MQRQDIPAARTPQDLERKYNFNNIIDTLKQNIDFLNNTKQDIKNFTTSILDTIKDFENQIDGKVDTYYYSGKPTLSTFPSSDWKPTDYESHIGDLYYDISTGIPYYFIKKNNTYLWEEINNKDIKEALSVANAAKDTADNKRRVFLEEPIPPYENGDLWINNGFLYVCQISKKADEKYDSNDFIDSLNYTDDSLARQCENQLEVIKGQVLTIIENVNQFKLQFDETIKTIDSLQQETIEAVRQMSYTFGTKNFTIADSLDPFNLQINNRGLKIYYYDVLNSIFNQNGSGFRKQIITESSQLGHIKEVPGAITSKHFSGSRPGVNKYYLDEMVETLENLEVE